MDLITPTAYTEKALYSEFTNCYSSRKGIQEGLEGRKRWEK